MCGMMQHIFTRKDLQIGGLDVQAGEIIDIIDGYKGQGYGKSTEEEFKVGVDSNNFADFGFFFVRLWAVPPFWRSLSGKLKKKHLKNWRKQPAVH